MMGNSVLHYLYNRPMSISVIFLKKSFILKKIYTQLQMDCTSPFQHKQKRHGRHKLTAEAACCKVKHQLIAYTSY